MSHLSLSAFSTVAQTLARIQGLSVDDRRREILKEREAFQEVARRMSRVKLSLESRPSLRDRLLDMGESVVDAMQLIQSVEPHERIYTSASEPATA